MVSFTGKKEKGEGVHKNYILWGNNEVRYKGKMLYNAKWIKAGILYLHDIVIGDRFINFTELSKIALLMCLNYADCYLQFPINGKVKSKRQTYV